jgi:hypothetical protein
MPPREPVKVVDAPPHDVSRPGSAIRPPAAGGPCDRPGARRSGAARRHDQERRVQPVRRHLARRPAALPRGRGACRLHQDGAPRYRRAAARRHQRPPHSDGDRRARRGGQRDGRRDRHHPRRHGGDRASRWRLAVGGRRPPRGHRRQDLRGVRLSGHHRSADQQGGQGAAPHRSQDRCSARRVRRRSERGDGNRRANGRALPTAAANNQADIDALLASFD